MTRLAANPNISPAKAPRRPREPILEQIASFIGFFIYLLVLKTYFVPLFQIPTGSMAEGLFGAHVTHTCPNCGWEYSVTMQHGPAGSQQLTLLPFSLQCPNCHWRQLYTSNPAIVRGMPHDQRGGEPLRGSAGDRIVVHGWPWEIGGRLGPRRWDVVVFKVPTDGETNYIKRLIGLPEDTVEIVDGNVYINGEISRKPAYAQSSLWFTVYHHDFRPQKASVVGSYRPRWAAITGAKAWNKLDERVVEFSGLDESRAEIQFVTSPTTLSPGDIRDTYGYNEFGRQLPAQAPNGYPVSDLRLAADVTFEQKSGAVELTLSKYQDRFILRLTAEGRLTLERSPLDSDQRTPMGEPKQVDVTIGRPVRLVFSNADYELKAEVNGTVKLTAPFSIGIEEARTRYASREQWPAQVRIAAERTKARFAHITLDRDVYYTTDDPESRGRTGTATLGHPLKLEKDQYFVLGDNSPQSVDARWWGDPPGPHLQAGPRAANYQRGTVPADQLIGKAFLVYWPGFLPLAPHWNVPPAFDLVPDFGRLRWIH